MRTNYLFLLILLIVSCNNEPNESTPTVSPVTKEEFSGIEELFTGDSFEDPTTIALLKEINICSDAQSDDKGNVLTPCTPTNFKMYPLKAGKPLDDGFVLLIKANTGGFALRRVLVFERENGILVKTNGFIANLIGRKENKGTYDDLLLRFIDKIDGSDVFYNCIVKWENGSYVFKTVELIQEPAGNFSGIVRADVKDSVSKEIYQILQDNQMIF